MKQLGVKFKKSSKRGQIAQDIVKQLELFRVSQMYNEDANVIAIASEFASLTSDVPWRKAMSPEQAVKQIVNNSYFTYTGRIMHEFLDYIAISLCENNKILKEGDYIVITSETSEGNSIFEACEIESVGRFQSRPGVRRVATVKPIFTDAPKLRLKGFDPKNLQIDPRKAHLELTQDDTRRIIYVVDLAFDSELYNALAGITS